MNTNLNLAGDWLALNATEPRYALIADIVRRRGPGARVLDLGCGSSVLTDGLSCARYVGVDNNKDALTGMTIGPAFVGGEWEWVHANIETWTTDELFDVIVLNEVLYYLDTPAAEMVKRYRLGCLAPGGVIVVSIFHKRPLWSANGRALREMRRLTKNEVTVTDRETGHTWSVFTL